MNLSASVYAYHKFMTWPKNENCDLPELARVLDQF